MLFFKRLLISTEIDLKQMPSMLIKAVSHFPSMEIAYSFHYGEPKSIAFTQSVSVGTETSEQNVSAKRFSINRHISHSNAFIENRHLHRST